MTQFSYHQNQHYQLRLTGMYSEILQLHMEYEFVVYHNIVLYVTHGIHTTYLLSTYGIAKKQHHTYSQSTFACTMQVNQAVCSSWSISVLNVLKVQPLRH